MRRLDFGISLALAALAIGWCTMRLVGLEHNPVGLFTDEGLAGLHVHCLAQTGRFADDKPVTLFARGLGGGLYTPAYLAALFVWTRIFDISIGSLRALSAVFCLIAIVGLWFLARRLADRETAWLVALAAALSPWSFQLSRLSTDAPAAPAFLVWGTYFFLWSPTRTCASLGGILLALAAYTYPPMRVQVPLLMVTLLVLERRRLRASRLLAWLGSFVVTSLPLVKLISDGTLMERPTNLSIFAKSYIEAHRGELSTPLFIVKQVLHNLGEHLSPSYLFFTGDPNVRHSLQKMGELGWLDMLALAVAAGAISIVVFRALFPGPGMHLPSPTTLARWRLAAVAVVVGFYATVPAALCTEGIPHAYRSIGAYPAVALFTGACLRPLWRRSRMIPILVLGLALAQTAYFFPNYFGPYRKLADEAFYGDLRRAAERHDMPAFEKLAKGYPELAFQYYLIRNFGHDCASSRTEAQRIRALP